MLCSSYGAAWEGDDRQGNGPAVATRQGLSFRFHQNNTYSLWTYSLPSPKPNGMATPDRSRFGKKVRQLRLAKGWTQEELAACTGLHPTYIGGVERGERNLGLDNLLKIARALGEHPSALLAEFPQ